jgi:hypothetical protein
MSELHKELVIHKRGMTHLREDIESSHLELKYLTMLDSYLHLHADDK